MTTKYFALLTNIGAAKLANATALGAQVKITQMAVGDGNGALPTPNPAQTELTHELRRAQLNKLTIDPVNTNQIIAEQVIPEEVGGWWIREIGLFDKDGDMIAVANCAETYKPQLQEGSGRVQVIRVILIVSSTDAVTLKIDPSVVLSTRQYVDGVAVEVRGYADTLLEEHIKSANPHSQYATTKSLKSALAALVASTPEALNTLERLAAALGNDPDFAEKVESALGGKQPLDDTLTALSGKSVAALLDYLGLEGITMAVNNAVKKSGDVMSGELSTTNMDSYRIKAGDRAFFLRFDGSDFYILKTAAGDPDGSWDGARPLRINAGDGRLYLGANTRIEGNVYAQDAFMQTDGNIYGSAWGGTLWDWLNTQINLKVSDIRFTAEHQVGAVGIYDYRNGNTVLTGFTNGDGDYSAEGLFWSYIQYYRSGQWITVGRS
ncbi:phage tail protein [Pantoea sp. JZ2]|uniref:phage tail protein n=1 Tax=Pantoea sp. JZ2 TaxID=2654189 RepID=UPI002B4A28E1|nr:phage tail protein [Pantoea sp. JZ2]WRH14274.1 phage tail protein [Pantoea sp. JZ2]